METENKDLAAAIINIERLAAAATKPQTIAMKVADGSAEGTVEVPVAFRAGEDGGLEIKSFAPALAEVHKIAKEIRLSKAEGPDRREGVAMHQSLSSLIDHANRFKDKDSVVWANAAERRLVSVLDYHSSGSAGAPRWGRHRGIYSCPLSEAWLAWGGGTELELSQDEFAALLDRRDRELHAGKFHHGGAAPDPAQLVTLANNLEVFSTATAKRERDPNTGRLKISYNEDKGVSGSVAPPPAFLVFISIFQDGIQEPLEVRLRVKVEEGQAVFTVQIHAAADLLQRAFEALCDRVEEMTALPVFVGTPE